MNHEECIICKKHREEETVIYQDDLIYVSHYLPRPDKSDNYLGYYFIEPRRHFRGIYDATDDEMNAIGSMMKKLGKALMAIPNMEHVYSVIFGDGVYHVHIHMIGRYQDAPAEYRGIRVDDWPRAPRGGKEEINKFNEIVKEELDKGL